MKCLNGSSLASSNFTIVHLLCVCSVLFFCVEACGGLWLCEWNWQMKTHNWNGTNQRFYNLWRNTVKLNALTPFDTFIKYFEGQRTFMRWEMWKPMRSIGFSSIAFGGRCPVLFLSLSSSLGQLLLISHTKDRPRFPSSPFIQWSFIFQLVHFLHFSVIIVQ